MAVDEVLFEVGGEGAQVVHGQRLLQAVDGLGQGSGRAVPGHSETQILAEVARAGTASARVSHDRDHHLAISAWPIELAEEDVLPGREPELAFHQGDGL